LFDLHKKAGVVQETI